MKRTFQVLFALAMFIKVANAQCTIKHETNGLRTGDTLSVMTLPYVDAGDEGNGVCWDFSNLPITAKHKIWFTVDSLSTPLIIEAGCNYKYRMRNDSLLITSYEDPQTLVEYEHSKLIMTYPFSLGDTLFSTFLGRGVYCGRHNLWKSGSAKTEADGQGVLVLEKGDTIRNVMRIYSLIATSVCMNTDSLLKDSASFQQNIEEHYLWYARGHRYPIFEIKTSTLYDDMIPIYTEQWARKLRLSAECSVTDTLNSAILLADSLSLSNEPVESVIDYTITHKNNLVTLNYSLSSHARLHIIVADAMGILHYRKTEVLEAGDNYEMQVDLNGLRRGRYIIYINVNGTIYNHKVEVI